MTGGRVAISPASDPGERVETITSLTGLILIAVVRVGGPIGTGIAATLLLIGLDRAA